MLGVQPWIFQARDAYCREFGKKYSGEDGLGLMAETRILCSDLSFFFKIDTSKPAVIRDDVMVSWFESLQ